MLGIGISRTITVGRTPVSAASCLKKTMRLASSKQSLLTGNLVAYPKYWKFEDRVFCWLHPDYRTLIDDFYDKDGPTLNEILAFDKIRRLDNECEKSLRAKLPDEDIKITDKQLLNEFYRVKMSLNRTPTLTDLGKHGVYSQRLWHKRFGGYRNFLKSLGETIKPEKITSQAECMKILKTLYLKKREEIGHPPQIFEMEIWNPKEFDRAVNYFGGWKKFVSKMQE